MFSNEYSRAVFEMGNVELTELKKSSIQCPSCLHHFFKGTLLCTCGKLTKPDQDVMIRIKEAFEILKAPSRASPIFDSQEVINAVRTCGSSIATRLETHYRVLQKATEDLLQSGTGGKMIRSAGNLSLPTIGRAHGLDIWTTLYISVSTTLRRNRKEKDTEPAPFIRISERTRLHNRIDASLQEHLEWLSTNWAEQFAEAHHQPSSSVTKLIMVEFVFMDSESAEMAPSQLAGRHMVRTNVSETTSNSRFRRSRTNNSANWCEPTQNDKLNVVTINQKV